MSSPWTPLNYSPAEVPSSATIDEYTLSTPAETDVWRPDTSKDVFTAPMLTQSMAAGAFKRITLTVSAAWKTQYDQGGLILFWPTTPRHTQRWIKAGIEFFDGVPYVGVVGCDRFADWSLSPVPAASTKKAQGQGEAAAEEDARRVALTLEAVREGTTLWIYALATDGSRIQALREIKWAFLEERGQADLSVGLYAAKPTPDQDDALAKLPVRFSHVKIERQ